MGDTERTGAGTCSFAGLAMMRKLMVLLVCLGGTGPLQAAPAQVIIIRHAEKPPDETAPGGNLLSLKGKQRAAALVPYFLGTPEVLEHKAPVAIYAQRPKKEGSSRRAIDTVQGVATALKLSVIQKYTREEFPQMVRDILAQKEYDGRMVLICWEHKVIPEMVRALGVKGAPDVWPGHAFDRTWIIAFQRDGTRAFKDLPQRLMYGDSEK
jgi:hypothetical protein